MRFGDRRTFAWVAKPLDLPSDEAISSAARSLAHLQIWCAGRNLCTGRDEDGTFDTLEVPLIDLATWLVEGWDGRIFDIALPDVLANGFRYSVPIAARWMLSEALLLDPTDAASLHAWASLRAVEFAGSDYLLPNVVFDRVDDFIRVSWAQRSEAHPFIDVGFTPTQGTVLVDASDFVEACMGLIRATYRMTKDVLGTDDVRVAQLDEFLQRDPESVGRRVARRWAPRVNIDAIMPREELARLGSSGCGGLVATFLRSSGSLLAAAVVEECLRLFEETNTRLDKDRLEAFTAGADTAIDPAEPWESGLQLARHVRARFAALDVCPVDGPVPITEVVSDLGVTIERVDLGTADADGVCLMDRQRRALAILNTGGRLSSTTVGQRSTLAHEFCHFAFDAPRFKMIGQADLRRATESILEKRANAFAAELLLPRHVIRSHAGGPTLRRSSLRYLASKFGVGMQLAEHQAHNAGIGLTT